ncbi:hypothetical protein SAY87_020124 [Trapa incisa]|uniref:Uncharacterized protein n=1 Tax=Trapa incisa TaxID=236973 RepID=A0AAN7Q3T6_9MYRT|nr:hypothetical protein SAY87_020124 [Trapa incisa]
MTEASTIRIQLHRQRQEDPHMNLHGEQPSSSAPGRTTNTSLATSQGKNTSDTFLATSQTMKVNVPRNSWDRMAPNNPYLFSSHKGLESSAPEGTLGNVTMAACTVPRNNGDRDAPEKVCSTSSFKGKGSFSHINKNGIGSSVGSGMCRTVPRCPVDSAGIEKPCLVSSLEGGESCALGQINSGDREEPEKICLTSSIKGKGSSVGSGMCRTVPFCPMDGREKPCSVSSLKGRKSCSPGQKNSGDASLPASQMSGTDLQSSGALAGVAKQSSHHGRNISTSINAPPMSGIVPPTGGDKRRPAPQTSANCVREGHLQSTSIPGKKYIQSSSIPGETTAKPGICRDVAQSGGEKSNPEHLSSASIRTSGGKKHSSHHGRIISSSVNASQLSGIVPPTDGDRRRPVPQTSANSAWEGHLQSASIPGKKYLQSSSIPGETTAKPEISGDVAHSGGENSNRVHLSSASFSTSGRAKQSSHHGRTISTSVNAPQMSGIVPPTGGDSRRPVPQTSANCGREEHLQSASIPGKKYLQSSSIPGETTAKLEIRGEGKSNPEHLSSASRQNPDSSLRDRPSSSEKKYAKLVEDWFPPFIQNGLDLEDDQQWLLGRKQTDHDSNDLKGNGEERKVHNSGLHFTHGSNSVWPLARFLPEASTYALPYTVPY